MNLLQKGIVTNKNCIVHYSIGSNQENGDEYPPELLSNREKFRNKVTHWNYKYILSQNNSKYDFLQRIFINPFLSLVGLGLGVYIVTLIIGIFEPILFTVHYYAWFLALVFTLTFLYHVLKLAK